MSEQQRPKKEQEKYSWKDYLSLGEVFGYFFRKKDPNRPNNFNLRMMHGINKLSILMFLIAMLVLLFRHIF